MYQRRLHLEETGKALMGSSESIVKFYSKLIHETFFTKIAKFHGL
ncbi:hypothetical protein T08_1194 [Trichinella sp. T8]|nr:hypothetical protein T08_1194 [Trichinella sp. T8]